MWKVNSNFKRSFVPHLQKKKKKKESLFCFFLRFFNGGGGGGGGGKAGDRCLSWRFSLPACKLWAGERKRGKCLTSWNHYETIRASLVTPWHWFYGSMCEMKGPYIHKHVLNLNPKKSPGVVLSVSVFSCVTACLSLNVKDVNSSLSQASTQAPAWQTAGRRLSVADRLITERKKINPPFNPKVWKWTLRSPRAPEQLQIRAGSDVTAGA